MIDIVNYGMGNLGSIQNMLKKIGYSSKIVSDPNLILNSDKLILPGVGSFGSGMDNLNSGGWIGVLEQKVLVEKVPVLGICLGMQLMTGFSEEGSVPGLGWIEGETIQFSGQDQGIRVPHMGWNKISYNASSPLFQSMPDNSRFYHVHSYYVKLKNKSQEIASTTYGLDFTSAFAKDNILGVQFHPEKSHKFGMQLLKNFADI